MSDGALFHFCEPMLRSELAFIWPLAIERRSQKKPG